MKRHVIFITIIGILFVGILTTYLIDMNRMNNNKRVIFSTWGYKYASPEEAEQIVKRKKISEANLKADSTNLTELVRFNDILYGRSYGIIDYIGSLDEYVGTIDYLIDEEYVPLLNGETNRKELLNAKVLHADEAGLILNLNGEAVLFHAIKEE